MNIRRETRRAARRVVVEYARTRTRTPGDPGAGTESGGKNALDAAAALRVGGGCGGGGGGGYTSREANSCGRRARFFSGGPARRCRAADASYAFCRARAAPKRVAGRFFRRTDRAPILNTEAFQAPPVGPRRRNNNPRNRTAVQKKKSTKPTGLYDTAVQKSFKNYSYVQFENGPRTMYGFSGA